MRVQFLAVRCIKHFEVRCIPFAHARRRNGIKIAEEIVQSGKKIKHPFVWEHVLFVERGYLVTAYLADEREWVCVFITVVVDRDFGVVKAVGHVGEAPPFAFSE
jgi:hypothetical protein